MFAVRTAISLALLTATAASLSAQDDAASGKRGLSNYLTQALADTAPAYNPPPPEPEESEEEGDEALGIKPKNGIVRLPRVVVEGNRPAVFTERQIHTDKGLAEIATRRYFADASQALNKFHIPFLTASQEELAMMMWEEDERLRHISSYQDQADMSQLFGNEEAAAELRELTRDTLGRKDYLPAPSALHRETQGN